MQRAIPAWQAKEVPKIVFPGRQFTGHSVLDSVTDEQPKRIPTIFAPFYSGFKFKLAGRDSPPGTTLFLNNLTFLVANGTYEDLFTSGMMDFFSFGTAARMCVSNRCDLAHSASCARSAAESKKVTAMPLHATLNLLLQRIYAMCTGLFRAFG
jgi:hypothetical protein